MSPGIHFFGPPSADNCCSLSPERPIKQTRKVTQIKLTMMSTPQFDIDDDSINRNKVAWFSILSLYTKLCPVICLSLATTR